MSMVRRSFIANDCKKSILKRKNNTEDKVTDRMHIALDSLSNISFMPISTLTIIMFSMEWELKYSLKRILTRKYRVDTLCKNKDMNLHQ